MLKIIKNFFKNPPSQAGSQAALSKGGTMGVFAGCHHHSPAALQSPLVGFPAECLMLRPFQLWETSGTLGGRNLGSVFVRLGGF